LRDRQPNDQRAGNNIITAYDYCSNKRNFLRHQRTAKRCDIPADYFAAVDSPAPDANRSTEQLTPAQLGTESDQSPSNSRQILLTATAHEYTAAGVVSIIVEFITTASTTGLNTGSAERLRPSPFPIELPARQLRQGSSAKADRLAFAAPRSNI
jgi:hypothetical protein